jgi:hypothetical protein
MQIDLSIIIVNYNTKDLTCDCIKSIKENTRDLKYEIILVDNNSNDGSVSAIKKNFKDVIIIENTENLGFSKANNQGIQKAKSDEILLLNSDTKLNDNSIKKAFDYLKKADILTIRIKSYDGKNQQAGGYGPNLFNLFCWAFFLDDLPFMNRLIKPYQISNLSFFDTNHEIDWVIGAFFMTTRNVIDKIGLLDENIFMYGEEMEYCRRAKDAGFKIKYFAGPEIIHYGMGSSETGEGAILGEYKALKYFFQKYGTNFSRVIAGFMIKSSIVLRIIIFNIIASEKAKIYEKAYQVN